MLRDSKVLDNYTPTQIRARAVGYLDIALDTANGQERIRFPSEKAAAKRLLQFLNEELYKGPITANIYETNSRHRADGAA